MSLSPHVYTGGYDNSKLKHFMHIFVCFITHNKKFNKNTISGIIQFKSNEELKICKVNTECYKIDQLIYSFSFMLELFHHKQC